METRINRHNSTEPTPPSPTKSAFSPVSTASISSTLSAVSDMTSLSGTSSHNLPKSPHGNSLFFPDHTKKQSANTESYTYSTPLPSGLSEHREMPDFPDLQDNIKDAAEYPNEAEMPKTSGNFEWLSSGTKPNLSQFSHNLNSNSNSNYYNFGSLSYGNNNNTESHLLRHSFTDSSQYGFRPERRASINVASIQTVAPSCIMPQTAIETNRRPSFTAEMTPELRHTPQFTLKQTSAFSPHHRNLYREFATYFITDSDHRVPIHPDNLPHYVAAPLNGMPSATLPSYPTTISTLILVAFKCGRCDVFQLPNSLEMSVQYGDIVIVDADRGKDMGLVVCALSHEQAKIFKFNQFAIQNRTLQLSEATVTLPPVHLPKSILRFAQPTEVQQLRAKHTDELNAKALCQEKLAMLAGSFGPSQMIVLDAEYQWDRRKLTFYYKALNGRVDFRALVKELFRIYKTRIWMCAVG